MAKVKLPVKLPAFVDAEDYHEFRPLQETLSRIFVNKITVEEIGVSHMGRYVAVVYAGRRPAEAVIQKFKDELAIEEDY